MSPLFALGVTWGILVPVCNLLAFPIQRGSAVQKPVLTGGLDFHITRWVLVPWIRQILRRSIVSTDFELESGTSQLAIVQRSNYQLPKSPAFIQVHNPSQLWHAVFQDFVNFIRLHWMWHGLMEHPTTSHMSQPSAGVSRQPYSALKCAHRASMCHSWRLAGSDTLEMKGTFSTN